MEGGEQEADQEGGQDGEDKVRPSPLSLTRQLGVSEVIGVVGHVPQLL